MKELFRKINFWNKYFDRREQFWLSILLVFGMALRTINALYTQLWRDEAYIFFSSRNNSILNLLLQKQWDTAHPPLYFIFLHFWQKISVNPFFLRLPSLLLSAMILYLIPVIAKKIDKKQRLFPLLVLFFYDISQSQISLNMVVRPYPFTILFILISIYFLLDFIHSQENQKQPFSKVIIFALTNFFIFFSDYSGVWYLLSIGVFFVIIVLKSGSIKTNKTKSIFLGLLLSMILCLATLPLLFINLNKSLALEVGTKTLLSSKGFFNLFFTENVNFFSGYLLPGFGRIINSKKLIIVINSFINTTRFDVRITSLSFLLPVINFLNIGIAALLVFCSLVGLYILKKFNIKASILMFCMVIIPLVLSAMFTVFYYPIFLGRNLFVVNLAVTFGLGYFVARYFERFKIFFTGLLLLMFISFFAYFPRVNFVDFPYDWQGLAKFLSTSNRINIFLFSRDPKSDFDQTTAFYFLNINTKFSRKQYIRFISGLSNLSRYLKVNKSFIQAKQIDLFFVETKVGKYSTSASVFYKKLSTELNCRLTVYNLRELFVASCPFN